MFKSAVSTTLLELSHEEVTKRISDNALFIPFRDMFQKSPALLRFVRAEKISYPMCSHEERLMQGPTPTSEDQAGYLPQPNYLDKSLLVDSYHPHVFEPFPLQAVWLPIEDITLYNVLESTENCPLFKKENGHTFVLFFIHPKSAEHYELLLEKYKAQIETVFALSLSSFRTLLIALPEKDGCYKPIMVKLSLDEHLRGVSRLLSEKKCQVSVGNTAMLQHRLKNDDKLSINIMKEPLAIIPKGYESAGMIYRLLPDILNPTIDNPEETSMIPLLSLLSVKNLPFFIELVNVSGLSVSDFLIKHLLMPVAEMLIQYCLYKDISFEIHAQNLGFVINKDNQVKGLMYRDMEGVNLLMDQSDRETCLPANLQDESIYYFTTHIKDAAESVEFHFVQNVLGPLTRQLAKCSSFWESDESLEEWVAEAKKRGYLENWNLNSDSDEYATRLAYRKFFRYGHVEYLFFDCLMAKLEEYNCFDATTLDKLKDEYTHWEKNGEGVSFPPCTHTLFFEKLMIGLLTQPKPLKSEQCGTDIGDNPYKFWAPEASEALTNICPTPSKANGII